MMKHLIYTAQYYLYVELFCKIVQRQSPILIFHPSDWNDVCSVTNFAFFENGTFQKEIGTFQKAKVGNTEWV